jgi:hypothetical protein
MALTRQFMDDTIAARPDNDPDSPQEAKDESLADNVMQMAMLDEMFEDRGKAGNRDFILGYATGIIDSLDGIVGMQREIEAGRANPGWEPAKLLLYLSAGMWQYLLDLSLDRDLVFYDDVARRKNLQMAVGMIRDKLMQQAQANETSVDNDPK